METTKVQPQIEDWPVAPERPETNKERIIRILKEAEGVVPQCRYMTHIESNRCALGVINDAITVVGVDSRSLEKWRRRR